ncbi:hypothetical protein TAMA11512_00940 [Selenomonas sp. TAMA-11512]|nr:hypothetical protein TAMA11512_00940 [Selenomonas sp. TAMA-11512]
MKIKDVYASGSFPFCGEECFLKYLCSMKYRLITSIRLRNTPAQGKHRGEEDMPGRLCRMYP